jgi:hypothetical protein
MTLLFLMAPVAENLVPYRFRLWRPVFWCNLLKLSALQKRLTKCLCCLTRQFNPVCLANPARLAVPVRLGNLAQLGSRLPMAKALQNDEEDPVSDSINCHVFLLHAVSRRG